MALTVASVFLMRWWSSSRISFCSFSAASRSGVDAGLGEQFLRVDLGLGEQQPKTDVFRREEVLGRGRRCAGVVAVGMEHRHQ